MIAPVTLEQLVEIVESRFIISKLVMKYKDVTL